MSDTKDLLSPERVASIIHNAKRNARDAWGDSAVGDAQQQSLHQVAECYAELNRLLVEARQQLASSPAAASSESDEGEDTRRPRIGKVRSGWDGALEWAAQMIETGYGSIPVSPQSIAMTLRAKKGDVELVHTGLATAMQVYEQKRSRAARSSVPREKASDPDTP